MKVSLNVAERLTIGSILFNFKGYRVDWLIIEEDNKKIALTEKEIKDWNVRLEGEQWHWDNAEAVDIELNDLTVKAIKEDLDKAELDRIGFALYKKLEIE